MSEEIKNHNHNGLDCNRINACNVEFLVDAKNFKGNRVEKVLLEIDKILDKKLDISADIKGFVKVEDGALKDSGFNENSFAMKEHTHNYLKKFEGGKNDNILICRNSEVEVSDINIKDIVKKKDLEKKQDKVKISNNNIVIGDLENNLKDSEININEIEKKGHKHNEYIERDEIKEENKVLVKKGNNLVGVLNVDEIERKGHKHNDYLEKRIDGNDGCLIVKDGNGLKGTSISLGDILLKKDKEVKVEGKDNSILVVKEKSIVSSNIDLNDLSFKNHTHKLDEIDGIFFKSKEEFKKIVKEIVVETLREIIKI